MGKGAVAETAGWAHVLPRSRQENMTDRLGTESVVDVRGGGARDAAHAGRPSPRREL